MVNKPLNSNLIISKDNDEYLKVEFTEEYKKLLTINAVNQSLEIVRRRIDDVGTKEPTILQRGEKRILVELPGLKNPERIKTLLGKTAKLNFRLVSENNEFGVDELISENGEKKQLNYNRIFKMLPANDEQMVYLKKNKTNDLENIKESDKTKNIINM